MFALVQSYEIREEIVLEPYKEDSDILFMEKAKERVSILLEEGMFTFLFPWDAHLPCLNLNER